MFSVVQTVSLGGNHSHSIYSALVSVPSNLEELKMKLYTSGKETCQCTLCQVLPVFPVRQQHCKLPASRLQREMNGRCLVQGMNECVLVVEHFCHFLSLEDLLEILVGEKIYLILSFHLYMTTFKEVLTLCPSVSHLHTKFNLAVRALSDQQTYR